jgi:hypothetical protein
VIFNLITSSGFCATAAQTRSNATVENLPNLTILKSIPKRGHAGFRNILRADATLYPQKLPEAPRMEFTLVP